MVSVLNNRIMHMTEGLPFIKVTLSWGDKLASETALNMTQKLNFTRDLAPPVNSLDSEPRSARTCSELESTW